MDEFVFFVTRPREVRTGGWQFTVGSVRLRVHGPFPTRDAAWAERRALERRWRQRAEALRGRLWVKSSEEWVVVVPRGTPVLGLRHHSEPGSGRKARDPRDDPPLRLRRGPWKTR